MNILTILNEVAATTKKTEKEAILFNHRDNKLLELVFKLAYDKVNYTFNIKKIESSWLENTYDDVGLESVLKETVVALCKKNLRGGAAQDFVASMFANLREEDKEVYRRVLMRDLEVGASGNTANKIWKDSVPSIPQMLARPYKDKNLKNIVYPAIAQKKADGVRGIAVVKDGVVNIYSRNANLFDLPTLKEQLSQIQSDVVIDGELLYKAEGREAIRQTGNGIVGKSLKGTISEEEEKKVYFEAWDIVDYDDYFSGRSSLGYQHRLDLLHNFITMYELDLVVPIETHFVQDLEEAKELSADYIEKGFEGIILKNTEAPWEDTRSKHQVKFKEVIDFDFRVVATYPHEKDPNKLGGLTLESECGKIRVNCGSGFKDKDTDPKTGEYILLEERHEYDRELLYVDKGQKLIGAIVEGTCNGVTQRKNIREGEAPYKVFLPIFKHFRFDKDAANRLEDISEYGG